MVCTLPVMGANKVTITSHQGWCLHRKACKHHSCHDILIEEKAVIGARTLSNKSVLDGATCVGVPGWILEKN